MTIEQITGSILQTFKDSYFVQSDDGDYFFMYGEDKRFPFATIVTHDDAYDNVSNLNREGFFRLNIGTNRESFDNMFATIPSTPIHRGIGGYLNSGIDFTQEDTLFPHPVYGTMHWISVVNPSTKTFDSLLPHLKIAYETAIRRNPK